VKRGWGRRGRPREYPHYRQIDGGTSTYSLIEKVWWNYGEDMSGFPSLVQEFDRDYLGKSPNLRQKVPKHFIAANQFHYAIAGWPEADSREHTVLYLFNDWRNHHYREKYCEGAITVGLSFSHRPYQKSGYDLPDGFKNLENVICDTILLEDRFPKGNWDKKPWIRGGIKIGN
jgi:hypothetical protein